MVCSHAGAGAITVIGRFSAEHEAIVNAPAVLRRSAEAARLCLAIHNRRRHVEMQVSLRARILTAWRPIGRWTHRQSRRQL